MCARCACVNFGTVHVQSISQCVTSQGWGKDPDLILQNSPVRERQIRDSKDSQITLLDSCLASAYDSSSLYSTNTSLTF